MESSNIDTEKVSGKVAEILSPHFKEFGGIEDIISCLLDDPSLNNTEKMFTMFAMGRRFENNRLYSDMQNIFKFGGHLLDVDPEEDEKV